MDHTVINTGFFEQFRGFLAVFLRPHLKIYVVEQSYYSPEIFFVSISQFSGKISHGPFYHLAMVDVEILLVVFFQQF